MIELNELKTRMKMKIKPFFFRKKIENAEMMK